MITSLSEQPWGRGELRAAGGRVRGSEPPSAAAGAARGTGEVGAFWAGGSSFVTHPLLPSAGSPPPAVRV